MNRKIKVLTLVLLASTLLVMATSLSVKAQGTATVAILSSVGGTTSPAGGTSPSYTIGHSASFTATPGSGWQFFYWIVTTAAGSTTYTTNPLSWDVTGAGSVQAMFLPTTNATETPNPAGTSSIYVLVSAGGETTPASETYTYNVGSVATFTATPGSGFRFLCWVVAPATGGIVYTANPLNYNVTNGDCAVQALFVPTSSTVTLPTIVDEYSSAAVVALTATLVAVAFATFAARRKVKK
jgi:hypothetical protein